MEPENAISRSLPEFFTTEDTEGTELFELKRVSDLGPERQCLHFVPGI